MDHPKSRADVAVSVDFENVYVSVREKFDAQPNFEMIMDRCEDYGRIVLARAYADWYRYPRVTSALFANGIEPMYVPTYHYDREAGRTGRPIKNSVDIHLCIDAMRTLYTQTHIDKFVLVTGDRDFIPLVNAIRQHGKEVIIIGIGGAASAHLAQSSDEFLFYEQIADLKPPQQRQEQQALRGERPERRERERPERQERERSDGNGKVEGRRERDKSDRAQQQPAAETTEQPDQPPVERSPFDTLVDAINLARQRGFVSNLGSLKVLMRELDSGFHESKVKDSNGKSFSKFKDFVKEAERQGKVQIFTNGTVTEVFLPGEDPLRVSQFAEDLASDQAERELERELEAEEAQRDPVVPDVAQHDEAPTAPSDAEEITLASSQTDDSVAEPAAQIAPEAQSVRPTFGDREWNIFRGSMAQFSEPVRFAEIFTALRGLRNQELLDLTNTELKELVKQAINRGMLQRTGRGARAYYRLSPQYRISEERRSQPEEMLSPAELSATTEDTAGAEVDSAAGLVSEEGKAPALRRRGRAYTTIRSDTGGAQESDTIERTQQPSEAQVDQRLEASTQAMAEQPATEIADTLAEQMTIQMTETPAPKPRRNRRRKNTTTAETQSQAEDAPVPENAEGAEQPQAEKAANGNGTKKRRTRRKKSGPAADESTGETNAAE